MRAWKITVLAGLVLATGGAHGGDPSHLAAGLERALRSPDADALPAVGQVLGPAAIEEAIASPARRTVLAAALAAPGAERPWPLLEPLAGSAAGPDRPIAVAAADAARAISRRLDRQTVIDEDVPDDVVRTALAAWRAVGADPRRWADVRVAALETGRSLHDALGEDAEPDDLAYDLTAALRDSDPEIRRAALELIAPDELPLPIVAATLNDIDPIVALVAAQVLCAGLAFDEPAAPILAAAGATGLTRIRALVRLPDQPPAAVLDAARCLARDPSAESAATMAHLAARGPRAIRAELRALARPLR
ncbi:MAG TPA: hypothetical protein VML75_25150 [Kofleriaceae bacterium]|nr:hypothetical protein [Kofleriaceae bacterium]